MVVGARTHPGFPASRSPQALPLLKGREEEGVEGTERGAEQQHEVGDEQQQKVREETLARNIDKGSVPRGPANSGKRPLSHHALPQFPEKRLRYGREVRRDKVAPWRSGRLTSRSLTVGLHPDMAAGARLPPELVGCFIQGERTEHRTAPHGSKDLPKR